jgi:glucose/mannose transport system substrate-binding protein
MKKIIMLALLSATALTSPVRAQNSVEVLHWWTSGGEAAAVSVLKDALEAKGITWNDMPVAGGSGENAMTTVRSRVTAGNPPTSVQMLGFDILEWADQGVLSNLDATASAEGWDDVVPAALQFFAKHDGHWVSAPVNVHSTNWVWASGKIMEELGVTEAPADFAGLLDIAERAKEAGYIGIAHGGQPWQEATAFDGIAIATGGLDWYKAAFIDLDPKAINSDTMIEALNSLGAYRALVDDNMSGRDWNLATAMVINDQAAFQIMGDWAKGEFVNAGEVAGVDFQCWRVPGTEGIVTFNADQFTMFDVGEGQAAAQAEMASSVMSPEFQVAFNVVKGSAPARTDVSDEAFDACGKKSMADLKAADANGTLVGSQAQGHANRPAVKTAFSDGITAFFNGELNAEEAAEEMADSVAIAQQ